MYFFNKWQWVGGKAGTRVHESQSSSVPPCCTYPRRSGTSPAVERLALNSTVPLQPCLTSGLCLEAKSARKILGYMVVHRPLGSQLISAPLERYIALCHSSALHLQYWSHTSLLQRQVGQCEATLQEPKGRVREKNYSSQPPPQSYGLSSSSPLFFYACSWCIGMCRDTWTPYWEWILSSH